LDVVGARSAQAFAMPARTEAVRADHRLRADDEAIRAQSTIWGVSRFCFYQKPRSTFADALHP
jgi:hypothetical protein